MTRDIVNLNKVRKEVDRAKKKAQADENAAKFGMTKAERILIATRNAQARSKLDQHELEDE